MKTLLWLDDERDPQNPLFKNYFLKYGNFDIIWVKSYYEFVEYIEQNGLPDLISFDHDLSDIEAEQEMTGYSAAKWLCDYCFDNDVNVPEYKVHSSNSVGKENIINYLENCKKHMKKLNEQDCGCTETEEMELKSKRTFVSESLKYHLDNEIPLYDNIFRIYSEEYFNLINEVRDLYKQNKIILNKVDKALVESDLGRKVNVQGTYVYLDVPIEEQDHDFLLREWNEGKKLNNLLLNEAEYKGKKVQLGKPKRGGPKKFYVYVKNPKTGNVKKVNFGDTTGLKAKINDPKARKAFAQRHKCSEKTDKTKPSYWSCRLPRYASMLGLKSNFTGYW